MKVNIYNFDYSKQKEFKFYFASDHHIDNMQFDENTFKYEHDTAMQENAYIFEGGDWGDFILKNDRKRYVKSRDTLASDAMINEIVDRGVSLFKPYANKILQFNHGNHEKSVIRYNSVDPTSMLIRSLNSKDHIIKHGSYCGFIVLKFSHGNNGALKKYCIYYNHGTGGAAEVTRGTIDLNRRQYISADMIWQQHKHTQITMKLDYMIGVNSHDQVYEKERKGLITGCFLKNIHIEEGGTITDTWTESKCRVTQARGGAILTLKLHKDGIRTKTTLL